MFFSGFLACTLLLVTSFASAQLTKSPTSLQPDDTGVLARTITAASTEIRVRPTIKYVDGVRTSGCFDTPQGFIRLEDGSGRYEFASYSTKLCNSTGTTLRDLRRGLSATSAGFAAGTGVGWDAGSRVRVVDYTVIYNQTAKNDVMNTFTGSGGMFCSSSSQPCFFTLGVSTAVRDAFTFGTAAGYYPDIFNTTTGVREYWNGSSWVKYGSGSTVNATTTILGKSKLASVSTVSGSTAFDASNPSVLGADLVLRHSTGAINNRNKVVATNNAGYLSGSLLGTSAASGDVLRMKSNGQTEWQGLNYSSVSGSTIRYLTNSGMTLKSVNPNFSNVNTGSLLVTIPVTTADTILQITFAGTMFNTANSPVILDFSVNGTRLGGTAGLFQQNANPGGGFNIGYFNMSAVARPGAGTNVVVKVVGYTNAGHQVFTASTSQPLHFSVIKIEP